MTDIFSEMIEMSERKYFSISQDGIASLQQRWAPSMEKELQQFVENNMKSILSLDLVKSEYIAGNWRVDSLAIDVQNFSPVIIEYKVSNDSAISQVLSYKSWMFDHKSEVESIIYEKYGRERKVDWKFFRIIIISREFNKYDLETVKHLNVNIDLYKYDFYGSVGFLIDLVSKNRTYKFDQVVALPPKATRSFNDSLLSCTTVIQVLAKKLESVIRGKDSDLSITELKGKCKFGPCVVDEEYGVYWITDSIVPRLKVALCNAGDLITSVKGVQRANGDLDFTLRDEQDLNDFEILLDQYLEIKLRYSIYL